MTTIWARLRPGNLPPGYRIAGLATGAISGVGLGLMLINGELAAAVAACVLAALVGLGVRIAAPAPLRRPVAAIVGLSFAMHVTAAAVLYFGSLAAGRGGFVTGDDASYANLSWAFARYLAGDPQPPYVPPAWAGDEYLFGTWVYLESAIFFVFGPRVLLPLLLNAALSSGLVLLLFDLCRRLFGSTAALLAAAVIAFYPSLMLWSSLNLKDALALFFIGLCLWCLARFHAGARWSALVGASAVLVLMESLRWYVFIGLAIIVPLAVVLAPRLSLVPRLRWSAGAALVSALLVASNGLGIAGMASGSGPLAALESTRQNMAQQSRTGFIDIPVQAREGDTLVVPTSPPRAGTTSSPESTPRIVRVSANTRLVVVTTLPANPIPGTVYVRPGDVVVVGGAGVSPAPSDRRTVLPRAPEEGGTNAQLVPATAPGGNDALVPRTLGHLPIGVMHALFAPFPWAIGRLADWLTLPDMLLWYGLLAAVPWTLWRARQLWHSWSPLLLFVGGILLILALTEGNVGTLYRHRAMVIPFVALLAAPSLLTVGRWGRARLSPPRPA